MNSKLYVGNLEYSVSKDELGEAFSEWEVTDCVVIEGKGFGFVTFASPADATSAKEKLSEQQLKGRPLKIDFAQERAPRNQNGRSGGRGRDGFKRRY